MDDKVGVFGFDLHATKFDTGNTTLRLWKGSYGRLGGGGGEIGLYASSDGHSLNRKELDSLGIVGSAICVNNKNDNHRIAAAGEKSASFWTTAFNEFDDPGKDSVSTLNVIDFKTNTQAQSFGDKLKAQLKNATAYPHNEGESLQVKVVDKSVLIFWGSEK